MGQFHLKPHVVILGAGPAGLGAAYRLAEKAQVTVIEQKSRVGGNAGSFDVAGIKVDYGSHRLHPSCDPGVLADIRKLIGDDLLDRPRHGRIQLQGRWIHFPLKPFDLALKLPPAFILGVAADGLAKLKPERLKLAGEENFATVMEKGLGSTICKDFYFPYARKIWGKDPSELSSNQARRRVSAGSIGKMVRRVISAVPGFRPAGSGRFYYPRLGFGQIAEGYYRAAEKEGVTFIFQSRVQSVDTSDANKITVTVETDNQAAEIKADRVWSTIPLNVFANLLKPLPPAEVLPTGKGMEFRAMILIYLVIAQAQFSPYDAHYFPDLDIPISRLSEPKNYSASIEPGDRTVLCAELPCSPEDDAWSMEDPALGSLVSEALKHAGIPIAAPIQQVHVQRLRYAYPIYLQGYEKYFEKLDGWIGEQQRLLTFGRQGLFAHDNTHHALFMAYCAADCLNSDGSFDRDKWLAYRQIFETHVVED